MKRKVSGPGRPGRAPHAARRARSRCGLEVDGPTLAGWARMIDAGRARYIRLLDAEVRVFELAHEGKDVRVLYDSSTRKIITVLPPDTCRAHYG